MKVQRRRANTGVISIPETRNYASAIKSDNTARDTKSLSLIVVGKCVEAKTLHFSNEVRNTHKGSHEGGAFVFNVVETHSKLLAPFSPIR